MAGVKDAIVERAQDLAAQAGKLSRKPTEAARSAAVQSAEGLKSLREPVRSFSRTGVNLTRISQRTAERLLDLQEKIVTSALEDAAAQLERAAATEDFREVMNDQMRVLMGARERIVADMSQALAILKDAGEDARGAASQTAARGKATRKTTRKKAPSKKKAKGTRAKRKAPARKKAKKSTRGRR
jgi:phasin family protein